MRIYGKNPVLERLKSEPKSILKLYLETGHAESGYINKKARKWGIPVQTVTRQKMDKIGRNVNTQGIMAEIGEFAYVEFDDLLTKAAEKKLCLVFLDGLTDPQNLGVIIRSLGCLGGFAIILPVHDSVSVTETTLRISCGGENYVSISRVANLSKAIREAKDRDFLIMGAVVDEGEDIRKADFQFPVALVIGSEQKGIRPVIRSLLDRKITLPMSQNRLSLNAAQATTLFCYEISRRRIS
ncbi:MAG: 23S rRNA (guanosine(2251)-2'-O)-methyltransferase RlmB [Candidatus Omnitrophota bacterium]